MYSNAQLPVLLFMIWMESSKTRRRKFGLQFDIAASLVLIIVIHIYSLIAKNVCTVRMLEQLWLTQNPSF